MTTLPAEGKTVLFEQIAELMPEYLRRCKVPDALAKRVLLPEPLEETTALRVVRGWLTTGERTLALVGNNGTGKTLAAIWAITKSIHRYQVFRWTPGDLPDDHRFMSALYVEAAELQARSVNQGQTLYDEEKPVLRSAKTVALLIVDEAGREDGDAARTLGPIISARVEAENRRTIICSNLLEEEFAKRYRGRILSRLKGSGRIVVCGGRDLRAGPVSG